MTRLAQVVQEALDILEWSDDIDDDEASGKSQLATDALISGQPCDIFIETHEQQDDICVYIYLPFRIRATHYPEACQLVNAINVQARHGHLEILPKTGKLRLKLSADVKGANPSGMFVVRMLQGGNAILCNWMGALAAVGITGRSASEALDLVASAKAAVADRSTTADNPIPEETITPQGSRTLH